MVEDLKLRPECDLNRRPQDVYNISGCGQATHDVNKQHNHVPKGYKKRKNVEYNSCSRPYLLALLKRSHVGVSERESCIEHAPQRRGIDVVDKDVISLIRVADSYALPGRIEEATARMNTHEGGLANHMIISNQMKQIYRIR